MKKMRKSIRSGDFAFTPKNPPCEDCRVDLHAKTCDESERIVEAVLSGSPAGSRILVIHGKGTGTLKFHIRKFLSTHPSVSYILLGEEEEFPGKDGVCLAVKK